MKALLWRCGWIAMVLGTSVAFCRQEPRRTAPRASTTLAPTPRDESEVRAYVLYKKGYGLLLDERWAEARKKLREILDRHPSSRYAPDASYWSAYALARMNRAEAAARYAQFLQEYPASRYCPDALADLATLRAPGRTGTAPGSGDLTAGPEPFPHEDMPPVFRVFVRNIPRQQQELRRMLTSLRVMPLPFPSAQTDAATSANVETIQSFADSDDGERSYDTLKGIALDPRQPSVLREAALQGLAESQAHNPVPLLLVIARGDGDDNVRNQATLCIARAGRDREESFRALDELFHALPHSSDEQRKYVLRAIAETDCSRSVPFLADVARTERNAALRNSAINDIAHANSVGDKSLDVLFDLFSTLPREKRTARQTVLFSVADIGDDKAVDFLINVSRSSSDDELRNDALYFLGTIGGEKAEAALRDILRRR